jgi:succinate dehydrogenase flavin-adding protein (antitoxin of CptAB toxin-antitoxin module)
MGSAKGTAALADVASAAVARKGPSTASPAPGSFAARDDVEIDPMRDTRDYGRGGESEEPSAETVRKRLVFQSRYRGMWELDMILGSFAADCVASIDKESDFGDPSLRVQDDDLRHYDAILREYDNDLNHWLIEIAAHCRSHGVVIPEEHLEPGAAPTPNLRGALPQRLVANPVWAKLVQYTVTQNDRIRQFR